MGDRRRALDEYVRTFRLIGDEESARLIEADNVAAPEEKLRRLRQNWERRLDGQKINAWDLAVYSAMLADPEETLRWAEKLVASRHPWATWINADPEFDFLRGDERFREILRKVNFL